MLSRRKGKASGESRYERNGRFMTTYADKAAILTKFHDAVNDAKDACENKENELVADALEKFDGIIGYVYGTHGADQTIALLEYLRDSGFMDAPASTRYHLAFKGGLLVHSVNVATNMIRMLIDADPDDGTPLDDVTVGQAATIGLVHDLCKVDAYVLDEKSGKFRWNTDRDDDVTDASEHGELSVKRAMRFLDLSDSEIAGIEWHMGMYDHRLMPTKNLLKSDDLHADVERILAARDEFEKSANSYATVKLAHIADMKASQIDELGM